MRQQPLIAGFVGGLLLGPLDLGAQQILPYPWANLANSSAVWALGAFALGRWLRTDLRRSALAGVVLLVVAVESYYLAAVLGRHDSLENLMSPTTQAWLLFAIAAGALFGVAGSWSSSVNRLRSTVGVALAGSVLFAEAVVYLYRIPSTPSLNRIENVQTALIEMSAGSGVLLLARRDIRQWGQTFAACLPLSALGFAAFLAGGFAR
jgi:Family of unknown function (DUF6518)